MLYFSEAVLQRFFSKVFCKHGQLYWNRTSVWVFPHKFTAYLQNNFFEEHLWVFIFSGKVVKKVKKKLRHLGFKKSETKYKYKISQFKCFSSCLFPQHLHQHQIPQNQKAHRQQQSLPGEACDRTRMRQHMPKSTYVYEKCTLK